MSPSSRGGVVHGLGPMGLFTWLMHGWLMDNWTLHPPNQPTCNSWSSQSWKNLLKNQQIQMAVDCLFVHWKLMNSYISSATLGWLQLITEKVWWIVFLKILHCVWKLAFVESDHKHSFSCLATYLHIYLCM